ncbi:DsbA family protein [Streptomyces griseorubiginosus]|uniref:DsbA family protein n=1 Tax=Streptomyces griseorubiginosus TaxID=67304 RepID=UPI0036E7C71F
MKLVYVFDAYCGWSHGFSATLRETVSRHPEPPVEVVSGGLFTGGRRVPIREFGHVQGANAQIAAQTGAGFGEGYERLIADGSFVMDSEAAARGVAALRRVAPDRAVELATALQQAFYVDGLSLSDPATYRKLAEQAGLDADAVAAAFDSPESAGTAAADFRRAAELGVTGFPTLLAVDGGHVVPLALGHATADDVDRRLTAFEATRTSSSHTI